MLWLASLFFPLKITSADMWLRLNFGNHSNLNRHLLLPEGIHLHGVESASVTLNLCKSFAFPLDIMKKGNCFSGVKPNDIHSQGINSSPLIAQYNLFRYYSICCRLCKICCKNLWYLMNKGQSLIWVLTFQGLVNSAVTLSQVSLLQLIQLQFISFYD